MSLQVTDATDDRLTQQVKGTSGAAHSFETGQIGGERNASSSTNNYDVIKNECNATVIAVQTAVTIGGGAVDDTYLLGLHIHTALVGTCVVAGFPDSAGAAASYTIPAATVGHIPFYAARNTAAAMTVTCSTVGDASKVVVLWRAR